MTLVIIIIPKKIIYVKNTIKNNVLTLIEDQDIFYTRMKYFCKDYEVIHSWK